MRLDRKLNLVLTVDREVGPPVHVHCATLGQAVVDKYFLTLSKTFAAMEELGGKWMLRMGPRFAFQMLQRVSQEDETWEGPEGVENGLVGEMRRLCNVLAPAASGGWETLPLADAVRSGVITTEDCREVENALTFFMVLCATLRPKEADTLASAVFGLWGAPVTSSGCTEYRNSLPTSTTAESIGAKGKPSLIPQ